MSGPVHDLLGVGIGPFNLGLACLSQPLDLDAVFLDVRDGFAWHHGLMLPDATVQVPFLADLVTLADPTSPFSFLAYLKQVGRLYPFYIREDFQPLRAEYDAYCRWASGQLSSLRWGREVVDIRRDGRTDGGDSRNSRDGEGGAPVYRVTAVTREGTETYRARHLVLGIGTAPWSPVDVSQLDPATQDGAGRGGPASTALHAADYLYRRSELLTLPSVTVVGSGQSAAEVVHDLLSAAGPEGPRVDWVTRSPRFFPMEYTKLTLEMTSPEYIDHFHALPPDQRDRMLREQRYLYKGINAELVNAIHELLYRRRVRGLPHGVLAAATVLESATLPEFHGHDGPHAHDGAIRLDLRCADTGARWSHHTAGLVLATGYRPTAPRFLDGISDELDLDHRGRYQVARDHTVDRAHCRIHVQNAEEHTHGLSAPDLGMGPLRNSIILRSVTGREVYPVEARTVFQQFGAPSATTPRAPATPQSQEAR